MSTHPMPQSAPARPRRSRWGVLAFSLVLLAAVPITSQATARVHARPAGTTAPNIVIILTDDERWDTLWALPNVQADLVAHGATFANAFAVNSLCCPARTSILTGTYSHTTGIYTNLNTNHGGFQQFDDSSTIATWLHDDGYHTGLVGKYLNGYANKYIPPGWDDWEAFYGNPDYYNYRLNENQNIVYYGDTDADYSTDVLAGFADGFIRDAPTDQPMFLWFATRAAHKEPIPPTRYLDSFSELEPYRPPNYNEADVTDKPDWIQNLPLMSQNEQNKTDGLRKNQYRTLLAVDDAVGTIVQALTDTGRLGNTMIVFASDNGYSWGEHRWTNKATSYEEDIRLPLVIRYDPLTSTPWTEKKRVANIDLAPTWAELAGVTPATAVEGSSMMPILDGTARGWRTDFLIEHYAASDEGTGQIPTFCALRNGKYMYTTLNSGEEELYNIISDPYQLTNVAYDPRYASIIANLRTRLKVLCDPVPPGFVWPY